MEGITTLLYEYVKIMNVESDGQEGEEEERVNMNIKQEIENDYGNIDNCLPNKKDVSDDENPMGTSVVVIKEEVINEDINRDNNENDLGYQHLVETGTYYNVFIKTEPIHFICHPETTLTSANKTRQRAYAPRAGGYNCVTCGDTFKWKKSLEQHMKKHAADDRQVEATSKSSMVTIKQEMDACDLATPNHSAHIKNDPADYNADETQAIGGKDNTEVVLDIKQETEQVGFGSERDEKLDHESERPITRLFEDMFTNKPSHYRCKACHITFRCENLLKIHTKTHKDYQFRCLVCGLETVSKSGMCAHEKSHTRVSTISLNEEEEKYKCTMCEFRTALKTCLKSHEREQHAGEKFYQCDHCGHKTNNKFSLSRHIRAHTGDRPIQCDFCDYKTIYKSTFFRHIRTHTGDKPYRCYVCGYRAKIRSRLMDHMKIHTGETYDCKYCEFKTTRQSSLWWHQRRKHVNQRPFNPATNEFEVSWKKYLPNLENGYGRRKLHACSVCDYVACSKGRLREHMSRHTNEKPYDCSMCDFKTAHKGALVVHFRTHTGEKPFECSMCAYKTAHLGAIKVHERTHTGEKPYACNMCNYKCAYLANLSSHKRFHTGEKPLVCSVCDFKTKEHGDLARHKLTHPSEAF